MFEIITAKKPQEANEIAAIVKQTSLVLATVLLASLLTACGGGSSSSDNNNSGGTTQVDTDNDGIADVTDTDDDNDGVADTEDAFPLNAAESKDTDGDGVGDNADKFPNDATESKDTDGDGTGDNADAFPNDATESKDTDGDGQGNTADTDDDNDGVSDADEIAVGTDPLDPNSKPSGTVVNGYTLLGTDGGNVASDATCVKSQATGLIWQAKMNKDSEGNYAVYSPGPAGEGVFRDLASKAITAFGSKCGTSKWRLPTPAEAKGIILRDAHSNPILDETTNLSFDSKVFTDTVSIAGAGAGWIPYCTSNATIGILSQAYAGEGGETVGLIPSAACFVRLVSDGK